MLRLALQSGKEGKRGKSATQFGNNNSTSPGLMKEYIWTLVVFIIWSVSHFFLLGMALFFFSTHWDGGTAHINVSQSFLPRSQMFNPNNRWQSSNWLTCLRDAPFISTYSLTFSVCSGDKLGKQRIGKQEIQWHWT